MKPDAFSCPASHPRAPFLRRRIRCIRTHTRITTLTIIDIPHFPKSSSLHASTMQRLTFLFHHRDRHLDPLEGIISRITRLIDDFIRHPQSLHDLSKGRILAI